MFWKSKNELVYEELNCLSSEESQWEIDGQISFSGFLEALIGWLPAGSILYFEDGHPDREIERFFEKHQVPENERKRVPLGSCGRPKILHAPATDAVLAELSKIMEHHAEPELAIHFHAYKDKQVLIQWYDAVNDPVLLNSSFPEEQIRVLAEKIGKKYDREA